MSRFRWALRRLQAHWTPLCLLVWFMAMAPSAHGQAMPPSARPAQDETVAQMERRAQVLFDAGSAEEALVLWRRAEAALTRPRDALRVAALRIHQGQALVVLRQDVAARDVLRSAVLLLCPDVLGPLSGEALLKGLSGLMPQLDRQTDAESDAQSGPDSPLRRQICVASGLSSRGPTAAVQPSFAGASDSFAEREADRGSAAFDRGEFGRALTAWRDAEEALREPRSAALVAELRYRQGRALMALRRLPEAVAVLRSSLELQRGLGNNAMALGAVLHALADATAAGNSPLEARALYVEARAQRRLAQDVAGEMRTLINTALLETRLGEWGRASALLDELTTLATAEAPTGAVAGVGLSAHDQGRWMSSVGVVRALLGQYEPALVALRRSAELSQASGDLSGLGEALRNQAFVFLELGEPEMALRLSQQAMALLPAPLASERATERAMALNGAGYSLVRLQRAAEAVPLLQEAVALQRTANARLELGRTLESLGSARVTLGEHASAARLYIESLAIARQLAARDDEREVLFSLGKLALAQQQPALAIVHLKLAVNLSQQLRAGVISLDREGRGAVARRLAEPYKLLARLLFEQGRLLEGEQVLFALKEAEFSDYTRGDASAGSAASASVALKPAEQAMLDELDTSAGALAQIYRRLEEHARGRSTLSDLALRDLQEREDDLLNRQTATLAGLDDRLRVRGAVAVTPVLQQLELAAKAAALSAHPLGENSAMLLYVPEERVTTVLIAGAFGARTIQLPVGMVTLTPLIAALRSAIDKRLDYGPAARALHALIVEPIDRELARAGTAPEMWMLFLTDELRYLPFATLIDAQGKHMVEKVRLGQLVTSAMDQLLAEPRRWSVAAFGSTLALPAHNLGALPGARQEVHALVRDADNPQGLLPGRGLLDAQFTRAAWQGVFQRLGLPAPRDTVVHVASHFKALTGDWNNSFLLLGGNEEFRVSELTGASNLSLRHVDLVTLSACATELNAQASGRELEGFGTLLLRRGARAVIGTLWSVQDEGTAAWMQVFYAARGEERKMSKAAALQAAQLALLRGTVRAANPAIDLRQPYYWAPFVLMGNWL